MNDLISRQAAIDDIDDYLDEYSGLDEEGYHGEKWCAMAEAKMVIEKLPSAQSEPRWIPCSERLPEKPDNYPHCGIYRTYFLVSLASECVKTLGYEFDRDEWQVTGSPVVAWMPLPEPYAERREE